MLKTSDTVNVLVKLLDVIPDHIHWCKGHYKDENGYCILGGLRKIQFDGPRNLHLHKAVRHINTIINRLYPDRTRSYIIASDNIIFFNDHEDTSYDDVRRVIQEAIATAE